MSFNDIDDNIKSFYTSSNDDLVNDFYNVVLSQTKRYDRLSGFFKSDSLAVAAKGIAKLIENEGHMRLLCGAKLSQEDLLAIENADDLKNIVSKNFLDEYENLENQLVKNHVLILGWMIANGFLEIKIGINTDGVEYYPDGMLHSKRGILYDDNGQSILFMGSVNETLYGWTKNIEDLRVDKSWKDFSVMEGPINNFEELWDGKVNSLLVFNLPEDSKRVLTESAPKSKQQVKKIIEEIEKIKSEPKDDRELFPHQKEAIKCWFKNNKKGILEMATGTGKTFTAVKCLEEIYKNESVLIVIACPFSHIIDQWEKDLKGKAIIHKYYKINPNWRKDFNELKFQVNLKIPFEKTNIILTTHNTFSNDDFIKIIRECDVKTFLIVDEVHRVGAKKFGNGLDNSYDYRLGLSATPTRYMDYDGTEKLINYFDKIVYKFTIFDALNKINIKTKKTFLTPYEYYPIKVDLTQDELKRYKEFNKKIAIILNNDVREKNNETLKGLFKKRKLIVDNAEQKYGAFRSIIRNLDHKNRLIVFCSDKNQLIKVLAILEDEGVSPSHKFTEEEGSDPEDIYNGLSQRQDLLKDFNNRVCKSLVAIKCLDEGVDVPSADQVIIMSSTTNPAEYIQRRGRVLRRFKDKEKAYIYDLCVLPNSGDGSYDRVIENEKKRLIEFIKTASSDNKHYCINLLNKWGLL